MPFSVVFISSCVANLNTLCRSHAVYIHAFYTPTVARNNLLISCGLLICQSGVL